MGKIVVNKHVDSYSQVTKDNFVNKGELIISNEVGFEGIFVLNKNNEPVFIGPTSSVSGITTANVYDVINGKTQQEINQIVLNNSIESSKHYFMSTNEYAILVEKGEVVVNGEKIVFDENAYYTLYESEE